MKQGEGASGSATAILRVEGEALTCAEGETVAGVLLRHGIYRFRRSPNAGAPRGPFCMMGACQECAILIDGAVRRACQTPARDGMRVELKGAGA